MLRRQGSTVASATLAPGRLDSYWRVMPSLKLQGKAAAWHKSVLWKRPGTLDSNLEPESVWYHCREGKIPPCSKKPWQCLSWSALSCSASENGQSFKKCDMHWVYMGRFWWCGGYRGGCCENLSEASSMSSRSSANWLQDALPLGNQRWWSPLRQHI